MKDRDSGKRRSIIPPKVEWLGYPLILSSVLFEFIMPYSVIFSVGLFVGLFLVSGNWIMQEWVAMLGTVPCVVGFGLLVVGYPKRIELIVLGGVLIFCYAIFILFYQKKQRERRSNKSVE